MPESWSVCRQFTVPGCRHGLAVTFQIDAGTLQRFHLSLFDAALPAGERRVIQVTYREIGNVNFPSSDGALLMAAFQYLLAVYEKLLSIPDNLEEYEDFIVYSLSALTNFFAGWVACDQKSDPSTVESEEDWALISGYGIHGVESAKLCHQSDSEQLGGVCLIRWGHFSTTRSTAEAVCRWWNAGDLEHDLQMIAQRRIDDFLAGRRSLSNPVAAASK